MLVDIANDYLLELFIWTLATLYPYNEASCAILMHIWSEMDHKVQVFICNTDDLIEPT